MKVSQLVKVLREGNKEAINAAVQNRAEVNQGMLETLIGAEHIGVEITEDNMGMATWYYIKNANGSLSSQFYWNDGKYDAQGFHNLYDEYGMPLGQLSAQYTA
tara:strand:+ start:3434 stop:3742 length:309 start_codon:yes stop_codon:yes gene_type:complete